MSKDESNEALISLAKNTIYNYIKYYEDNEFIKYIDILNDFSSMPKEKRDIDIANFKYLDIENNQYVLKINNEIYPFSILSDEDLLDVIKIQLEDKKERKANDFFSSVKLLLSKEYNTPILHTVLVDNENFFHTLIEYEKDNTKYIINYGDNIIMKKDDYIKLYNPIIMQSLDQYEVAVLKEFFELSKGSINGLYISLFGREILKDLSRIMPHSNENFDTSGINQKTKIIVFKDAFSIEIDRIYSDMENEIEEFTLNPNVPTKNIKKDEDGYIYKDNVKFSLLSDFYRSEDMRKMLLSDERYGWCHGYSLRLTTLLSNDDENVILVSGKVRRNDKESIYHSWVESNEIVIDFTRNLIMAKDDYYNMTKARVITKTTGNLLQKNLALEKQLGIEFESYINCYFSEELNRDLKRIEKQLIKK